MKSLRQGRAGRVGCYGADYRGPLILDLLLGLGSVYSVLHSISLHSPKHFLGRLLNLAYNVVDIKSDSRDKNLSERNWYGKPRNQTDVPHSEALNW